jgi:methylglutaconyl-CoA hydratase
MNFSLLTFSISDRIGTITLNRPDRRNALDDRLVEELTRAITVAANDKQVKVILLTGAGSAFCSGADIEYLQKLSRYSFEDNLADSKKLMTLFHLIYTVPKPVLAMVNGPAIAGGCGLATVCDIVVASDKAQFGYSEVKIGFIPAIVLTFLVRRIGEARARDMVLRGTIIDSARALEFGIANEVVHDSVLTEKTMEIAQSLCENASGTSMGLIKEMLSRMNGIGLQEMLEYSASMNATARMSDDCKRGIDTFLRKEKIRW